MEQRQGARTPMQGVIREDNMIEQAGSIEAEGTPKAAVPRASFGRRLAAYAIDAVALSAAGGCLSLVTSVAAAASGGGGASQVLSTAATVLASALPLAYFAWSYSITGETLGKRLMHIRVVSLDGSPLGLGKGIARALGYVPSGALLGLGFLWALWDKDKQAWHDKMAGTCVVPASIEPEQLQGTIDPGEAYQRRRRWLLGLGIPSLVVAGMAALAMLFFINKGVEEVRAMEPWPSAEVEPQEFFETDLAPLGLRMGEVADSRSGGLWAQGTYETGRMAAYTYAGREVAYLWILRHESVEAASSDYQGAQAWAADVSNCPASRYAFFRSMGTVQCMYADAFDKVLWNDIWLIDIVAVAGGPQEPEILANAIRDALAAHWKDLAQTRP